MAVLVAATLLASILSPLFGLPDEPYDGAAVESQVEETPSETAPEALKIDPHSYLYASYPRLARRLDCVITRESRWQPDAYNPRSGAAGVAQFLYGTWLSTPQGKAGASRYDPFASIDGAVFLIENDRKSWGHWVPVLQGAC